MYYGLGVSWIAVSEINWFLPSKILVNTNSVWVLTAHSDHALKGILGKKRV